MRRAFKKGHDAGKSMTGVKYLRCVRWGKAVFKVRDNKLTQILNQD